MAVFVVYTKLELRLLGFRSMNYRLGLLIIMYDEQIGFSGRRGFDYGGKWFLTWLPFGAFFYYGSDFRDIDGDDCGYGLREESLFICLHFALD